MARSVESTRTRSSGPIVPLCPMLGSPLPTFSDPCPSLTVLAPAIGSFGFTATPTGGASAASGSYSAALFWLKANDDATSCVAAAFSAAMSPAPDASGSAGPLTVVLLFRFVRLVERFGVRDDFAMLPRGSTLCTRLTTRVQPDGAYTRVRCLHAHASANSGRRVRRGSHLLREGTRARVRCGLNPTEPDCRRAERAPAESRRAFERHQRDAEECDSARLWAGEFAADRRARMGGRRALRHRRARGAGAAGRPRRPAAPRPRAARRALQAQGASRNARAARLRTHVCAPRSAAGLPDQAHHDRLHTTADHDHRRG